MFGGISETTQLHLVYWNTCGILFGREFLGREYWQSQFVIFHYSTPILLYQ